MTKKLFIFSTVIKSLLILVLSFGLSLIVVNAFNMQDPSFLTYFTNISNIFILITTVAFLIFSIRLYLGKNPTISRIFFTIRFFSIIAITITGFIYCCILVPVGGIELFDTYTEISFHLIVPVLAIIDFVVNNEYFKITVKDIFLSTLFPILYFIYVMILSYSGFTWLGFYTPLVNAPYPFLDYKENTWFGYGKQTFGVFYWINILVVIYIAVGLIYKLVQYYVKKPKKVKSIFDSKYASLVKDIDQL